MAEQELNEQANEASPKLFARIKDYCDFLKRKFDTILWVLGVAFGIIVGIWLILGPRVDQAVKGEVFSQEVLDKISTKLRPYAVVDAQFNTQTTFEYDAGVGDMVESLDFYDASTSNKYDSKAILIIKMKKYVPVEPLVTQLTPTVYVHSFWRTNKFDWAYEIRPGPITENGQMEIMGISPDQHYRFLIQLLTK